MYVPEHVFKWTTFSAWFYGVRNGVRFDQIIEDFLLLLFGRLSPNDAEGTQITRLLILYI